MGCENSVPKEGTDYTATTKVEAGRGARKKTSATPNDPSDRPSTNNNNNDTKPKNNSGAVNTYYDDGDLDDFNNHVKKEHKRKEAEEARKKKEEEENAAKKKIADEEKRRQQEAEWEAFEKEDQANTDQLRADINDGKIKEDVLTL